MGENVKGSMTISVTLNIRIFIDFEGVWIRMIVVVNGNSLRFAI